MTSSVLIMLLLFIAFSECDDRMRRVTDPECKLQRYPKRGSPYVGCQYGDKYVNHGRTTDSGSSKCLGLYCWNGTLTPLECRVRKPSDEKFNYTREEGPWPYCCYFLRTCKQPSL
ncbi:uncharacterized protein [Dermacentor albipictus]|uniref:uncharacterized protein n=1 Tax=Dermacentor albipictus TaxID=60249 RepID=UPI0038FCF16E